MYCSAQPHKSTTCVGHRSPMTTTIAIGTFIAYFGKDAYSRVSTALYHGLGAPPRWWRQTPPPSMGPKVKSMYGHVFIAGVAAMVLEWIQYQGAHKMREYTRRGPSTLFYETYKKHPYYRGEQSYLSLFTAPGNALDILMRRTVNTLVGVSVQVEQMFIQNGNFDHLQFISNMFQALGFYELMVFMLHMHGMSPVQNMLSMIVSQSTRIKGRD